MTAHLLGDVPPVVLLGVQEQRVRQQHGLYDHQVAPLWLAVSALYLNLHHHLCSNVMNVTVNTAHCIREQWNNDRARCGGMLTVLAYTYLVYESEELGILQHLHLAGILVTSCFHYIEQLEKTSREAREELLCTMVVHAQHSDVCTEVSHTSRDAIRTIQRTLSDVLVIQVRSSLK